MSNAAPRGLPSSERSTRRLVILGRLHNPTPGHRRGPAVLAGVLFRTVNLKIGVQSTPEYRAINRWGVVPSLRHRGLTILQSNVILDYLARETGHFEGASEQQRWQAREWLSWEADHITAAAKERHSARFHASHPQGIGEFRPT